MPKGQHTTPRGKPPVNDGKPPKELKIRVSDATYQTLLAKATELQKAGVAALVREYIEKGLQSGS